MTAPSTSLTMILPNEILAHIFSYLSPQDLLNVELVNKLWAEIAKKPYLWQDLIKQHFPYLIKRNIQHYADKPRELFTNEFIRITLEFDKHLANELKSSDIGSLKAYILPAIRGEVDKIEKYILHDDLKKALYCLGAANGHGSCLKQLDQNQKVTALIMAIQYGNFAGVELLFHASEALISSRSPALPIAAQFGDLDIFRFLWKKLEKREGKLVTSKMDEAFLNAAKHGHLAIVQEISSQFTEAITSEDKKTAMIYAAEEGHLNMLMWLLNEFKIDANQDTFKNIFICAAEKGHLEIIQNLLLNYRHNLSKSVIKDAFLRAANCGKASVVRELLLQAGQDITCEMIRSGANEASQRGYIEVLKELFDLSPDMMITKKRFLVEAAKNGYYDIVEYCLGSNQIDAPTLGKALSNAAANGRKNIFAALINYYLTIPSADQMIAISTSLKNDNGITRYCLIHCTQTNFSEEQLDAILGKRSASHFNLLPIFTCKNNERKEKKRGVIRESEVRLLLQEAETFFCQKRRRK